MSSASQIDHATIPEDQLAEMLSKVKSSRETEALRARLLAQLAPFASNISIIEPIQTVRTSPTDGVHLCTCKVKERRICMSVAVVPSPYSQSQDSEEPDAKPLKLIWRDWWTRSKYLTGSADSHMHSIFLQYGPPRRGMHSKAFTGWYDDDPGTSVTKYSHGGVKSVVEEVVRDMGFRESELDYKLEIIEALLGDDKRELLERYAQDGTTTQHSAPPFLPLLSNMFALFKSPTLCDNIHCRFQLLQSRLHNEVRLQLR